MMLIFARVMPRVYADAQTLFDAMAPLLIDAARA